MTDSPMTAEELTGKSRADLLVLCQARGLKASGWKRDRMYEALTGTGPAEVTKPDPKEVAAAIEERLDESENAQAATSNKKELAMHERLKLQTGACIAIRCRCEGWIPGGMDANRFWNVCDDCGHTQSVHERSDLPSAKKRGQDAPLVEKPDDSAGALEKLLARRHQEPDEQEQDVPA